MSDKDIAPEVEEKLTSIAKKYSDKIDAKIEEAQKAWESADKEGREELSGKQEELKGEIKELVDKYDKAVKEIDEMKAEFEKARSFNPNPIDTVNKAFKDHEEEISKLVNKSRNASATVKLNHDDLMTKATMTTGLSLEDRRVIPYDRVIQSPVYDPEETPLEQYFRIGSTSSDSVEWPIEQVPGSSPQESWDYDNNAAAVDSDNAAEKPESEFQWDLETRTVRDIAHTVTLHKNLMDDLPLLQSYLPQRLRDGLFRETSRQILRGQDASQEIIGLNQTGSHADFDSAGFQAAVVNNGKTVGEANFIDILGYAKTQLRLGNYVGTLILMNPEDFYSFMFSVDNDGDYHMNNPVWLYVAGIIQQSNYVNQGEFYVLDRNRSNFLLNRQSINVDFSYENKDNFVKNLVTIRAERRMVQVTERPNGIILGDFDQATS
ncbi:phage major capsid protein [Gracilimonas sp.]|uniref:phage major capsid protein n=1 Tax=Gracilimonas sp. TaxID=1974203 RepID=UPI002871AE9E|nr:phage major capsid protein [Gracilimonas sp.]